VTLGPGQEHESTQVEALLDQVEIAGKPGPPRTRLDVVAGDKGYDSAAVRELIQDRGSEPLIAHRRDRQGGYPEAARGFDKKMYRRRNVVERLIGRLKDFRRIAMRFEKLADSFLAVLLLGFIKIWLRDLLPDRP
jgi:transposase